MKKKTLSKMFGFGLAFTLIVAGSVSVYGEDAAETAIELSDEQILVNGAEITSDTSAAVYAGAEIVYYEEGHDETYGEGDEGDGHSAEEAAAYTVITITQPGTYRVSGTISKGQIAVDLGEDAEDDEAAIVNLILDNANITCDVASAIVVYNAYECGDDEEDSATKDVDTAEAGFNLILADDSENVVNGSHVAKIYEDGTTAEQVENDEAEKKWKFDAAIDSLVSFNINGENDGNGKMTVNADNEGISSALHMSINGGEITINSSDDAINTSEDYVSVLNLNGGILICDSGLGKEGDGIDSNGWIVVNGGYTIASGNGESQDSGIDSDLGIYINGGTLLASGNMYDEVSSESAQKFMVLSFSEKIGEGQLLLIKDSEGNPVTAFSAVNAFQTLVYSSELLADGDCTLYKVSSVSGDLNGSIYTNITFCEGEVQLQYSANSMMAMGGRGGFGGGKLPEGMEAGERPEMLKGMEAGEMPELPEGMEAGEMPEMPEGMENGERPEMPERAEAGEMPQIQKGMDGAASQKPSTIFTIQGIVNQFAQIQEAE